MGIVSGMIILLNSDLIDRSICRLFASLLLNVLLICVGGYLLYQTTHTYRIAHRFDGCKSHSLEDVDIFAMSGITTLYDCPEGKYLGGKTEPEHKPE